MNFQIASSPPPTGYSTDIGREYSAARGYGWVRQDSLSGAHTGIDIQDRGRDRQDGTPDQRFDTFIGIDKPTAPVGPSAAWEAAVPNGSYTVVVGAGDPSYFDSNYRVNVEGTSALSWTATSGDRQRTSAPVVVNVTDGRLTLDGIGGSNTKFSYVDITSTPTPPSNISVKYNFAPTSAPAVSGYTIDSGAAFATNLGYGWVRQDSLSGVHQPVNIQANSRQRNAITDRRLDTFIHMQFSGTSNGTAIPAAWEQAVANGKYDVTVGTGDPSYNDSVNSIRIEGQTALDAAQTEPGARFRTVTKTVTVSDGRLTVDAIGGTNTKIDYVTIDSAPGGSATRPSTGSIAPADGSTLVARGRAITAEVHLPNLGAGVDPATLTTSTVRLERIADAAPVAAVRNTSGGGDVIVIQPTAVLEPNTEYRVIITSGVKDSTGAPFEPASSTFSTNSDTPGASTLAKFVKTPQASSAGDLSASLQMGPDNRLYATTLTGKIQRYPVNADGSLGTPTTINTVTDHEGGQRHILGLAFDPAATAANPILWISHSAAAISDAPDWAGKISRLSGANLGTIQDYVTNLPRSVNDHETNSLAFGPDGKLYLTQGSNSAAGAPDVQWGMRPEHKLNAAVLKVDPALIPAPPLNVRTEEGGTYDPFAANAPVSIYASGVRNAYDLVWHTNGQLYTAVNGTAAGGNTPSTPSTLPNVCQHRIDFATRGAWTGPAVTGQNNIIEQPDLLFRIAQGGYYGHPNPARCEYSFFGANPTAGNDPLQLASYPVGTQVDRNYRSASYNFGLHFSPDGMIEYKSNTFGGALKGRLLVTRYSAGDDIVALSINPTTKEITTQEDGIPGLGSLTDPLDLTEDTRNGNLYVTELGAQRISLLKPDETGTGGGGTGGGTGTGVTAFTNPDGVPSDNRLAFSRIGSIASPPSNGVHDRTNLVVRNTGSGPLKVNSLPITGTGAAQFALLNPPALPATIAPGGSLIVGVRFIAQSGRLHTANLTVNTDSATTPASTVALSGYWQTVSEGGQEPTVQEIVNDFGYKTAITNPGQDINGKGKLAAVGDEVLSPYWRRLNGGQNITVTQLAAYHTQGNTAFISWYTKGQTAQNGLTSHAGIDGQSILPHRSGSTTELATASFATSNTFGFKIDSEWSDDSKNDSTPDTAAGCTGTCGHHLRFWPVKDNDGNTVTGSYFVSMDYSGINYDYNDNVYLLTNITPETIQPTGAVLYRLDTGASSNYTDTQGRIWGPDTGLFSPSNTLSEGADGTTIAGTTESPLFASYRGNVGGSTPLANRIVDYTLPTTATKVDVKLYFAERYWNGAGQRVFDVSAEGALKIDNLDIFARAGGKNIALTENLPGIDISGPALNLRFKTEVDMPSISAIEVFCAAGC